ncbi:MAG: TIGR04190 family B12-binding domain/radical SAM domain protein [Dehalococcoidia bacterium]|nr:TIGR04190 family B12-binding domain/radical SAM domain protein [Dehalococcoidia bacterium]
MPKTDLILLHAPHVYDFRKVPQLYGPVSDLVLSTPIFEMYPVGLSSISEYLEKNGFRTRIVNIAWRMLRDARFDAEAFIKKLKAPVFGIDLHWMVHAHGSIEIAKIVKKYHPDAKIIFGGYSSSRFYKELIMYPEVDFVMRGDSTEEPMRRFMQSFMNGAEISSVPNLVWKDAAGEAHENEFSYVPTDISHVMGNHYGTVVRQVLRYRDLASVVPFKGWLKYPVTAVFTSRGCKYDCIFCSAARDAMPLFANRKKPAYRSADDIFKDIKNISGITRGPILLVGDIRENGDERAHKLLGLIKERRVKNTLMFEAFNPMPSDFIKEMAQATPGFSLDMSPESHDPEVRRVSLGRSFSNEAMEDMIQAALDNGASRVEIFYMIGLHKQDTKSVLDTVDYCEHLLQKFKADKRLFLFMGHQAPFMAPGSLAFEYPERYGFKLIYKTLEEHRHALTLPSWKFSLNYETQWLSRDEITDVTYESIARLTKLKARYGQIPQALADRQIERIERAKVLEAKIEELMKAGAQDDIAVLRPEMDAVNGFTASERLELEIPVGSIVRLRYFSALFNLLFGRRKEKAQRVVSIDKD